MKKSKNAFTMIEMIFVIVVLGILAAIAVPKLAATRTDAEISKGIADVASVRSAIITERQSRLIIGCPDYIPNGTGTYTCNGNTYNQMDNGGLFGGVLMYPIENRAGVNGKWSSSAAGTYKFRVNNIDVVFTYYDSTEADVSKRGTFTCSTTNGTYGEMCKLLIN
ncbi:prepilin-type N-terminal cleavage/methylation domain-containing protein [Sulfurimonas sp.]|uniref:type II secretion system protein n=1 Tax=Sulfurimonas sp. TaxID=2022749 RepID=UPI001A107CCC|nr:prepilin-type N-terminal cleavage/methylation domain-containing protein [Sulfurimonas sp.]MBE0514210.1 prepilin-type N-terminal cleavage/methylation domain-containing protein [Sulfurimonas sp.]